MAYNRNEVNIIMDCIISYRKLRIILMDRKLKPSFVCKEVGLSHNVGGKIMNDENIEVLSLAKICLYLGVSFDEVIDISIGENR
jgi:DNA-binding Xre family transcriptional regulator